MDGSFIPPPFPFVEAWPRIYAEKQQQWLTPWTLTPLYWSEQLATETQYYPDETVGIPNHDKEEEGEDDDGDYEYGYVLSDEWRTRFQSSNRQLQQTEQQRHRGNSKKKRQQQQKKKKTNTGRPKQVVNNAGALAAKASRSEHLQCEVQAARARELANKWKHRDSKNATVSTETSVQVKSMETSLNVFFDEFCDAFQPVVWPHDSLH